MTKIDLPHGAWVLVGDGRKALVLRNEGDAVFPNLKTADALKTERAPSTAEMGTDRPGRTIQHHDGRRSGMDQTDWHEIAEQNFAHDVARALDARHAGGEIASLVVVAPPRTLAELRRSFSDGLRAKIVAEVDKDMTKHPVHEIERLLFGGGKK